MLLADANGPIETPAPTSLNDLLGATGATGYTETVLVSPAPEVVVYNPPKTGFNWIWVIWGIVAVVVIYGLWKIIKK